MHSALLEFVFGRGCVRADWVVFQREVPDFKGKPGLVAHVADIQKHASSAAGVSYSEWNMGACGRKIWHTLTWGDPQGGAVGLV